MVTCKCPLCESPCMIKIIATSDERWCEVDVCKMCGTMYPRDKEAVLEKPAKAAPRKRSAPKTRKNPKKGRKRKK